MLSKEQIEKFISIEKNRICDLLKTENEVLCEYYRGWGCIHTAFWIYREDDIESEIRNCVKEDGFVCFKSSPNCLDLINAAALLHFGVKNFIKKLN